MDQAQSNPLTQEQVEELRAQIEADLSAQYRHIIDSQKKEIEKLTKMQWTEHDRKKLIDDTYKKGYAAATQKYESMMATRQRMHEEELATYRLKAANLPTPETGIAMPQFSSFDEGLTPRTARKSSTIEPLFLGQTSYRSIAGQYMGWNDEVEIVAADRWIALPELLTSLQIWKYSNFSVKAIRDDILKELSTPRSVKPCSRTSRYPDNISLVNIDNGAIASLLQHVNDALSFSERSADMAATSSSKTYGSYNDAKVAFSRSIMRISEMVRSPIPDMRVRYGIFNRFTFESYYALVWV